MAQATLAPDIRGVTIPVTGGNVLLPNACVSEVITYGAPQALDGAGPWILGTVNWRGWRMPLFSMATLAGLAEDEPTVGAKVAVLKAFGGVHKMPYMAMLAQGFPRLTTVTADNLLVDDRRGGSPDEEADSDGVLYRVSVEGEVALIPDLGRIEGHLLELMAPQVRSV